MAETTVPMDDSELMSAALVSEPAETPAPEPAPEAEQSDRARDDKGRFVAKEPEPEKAAEPPAPATPAEPKDDAHVPSWRLREVREAREAAERKAEEASRQSWQFQQELAELRRQMAKPKPEPVDFFQNPDQAFEQRLSPIEERIQSAEQRLLMRASRAEAVAEYGKASVAEMEAAVQKAMQSNHPGMMALSAQMRASDDPVGVAMQWYRQNSLYERTGGDLDAYVNKQVEERLKDPAFLAKAMEAARSTAGQTRPNIQLPPSLNRQTGSGVSDDDVEKADMSDAALYRHATAKGGR